MTVAELIEALQDLSDQNAEVKLSARIYESHVNYVEVHEDYVVLD